MLLLENPNEHYCYSMGCAAAIGSEHYLNITTHETGHDPRLALLGLTGGVMVDSLAPGLGIIRHGPERDVGEGFRRL